MAQREKILSNEETYLWKLYKDGLDYQARTGLSVNIPKFVDFYEGRQWPQPTESTKNLPRPVVNIVKMICRNKKSSILSTPVRILYKSYSEGTDIDKLNSFVESMEKELDQEGLDRLALDDGVKKGSYFYHYYWDKDAIGTTGKIEGGVRCEIIDPLNIFFSNPAELDEQKQDWILISTHTEPLNLYRICDKELFSTIKEEAKCTQNGKRVTLLTRYFRVNGEIWCERATKYCIINKPFPISPRQTDIQGVENDSFHLKKLLLQRTLAEEENSTETEKSEIQRKISYLSAYNKPRRARACLYPIVCGYYERREGSIYGISEVEAIIPNQKAINFNIAMSLLNAQQCAWGKYIALPNALKGQRISNSPGQVLIDHSGTGNGIKRMSEESLSSVPMALTEALTELTRVASGATEILTSEAASVNMSGVAIAQLQSQAEVPLEELRAGFIEVKKKQGKVLAQFIRLFYFDKEFIRRARDKNGNEREYCDYFYSKDYENSILDVIVEPTKGTKSSISSDINLLDTCLKTGKISLETYIRAYPEGAVSNKSAILRQIEAEKSSEIEQLRKELEYYKNGKTLDPVSIV